MRKVYLLLAFLLPLLSYGQKEYDTFLVNSKDLPDYHRFIGISYKSGFENRMLWQYNDTDSLQFANPDYNDSLWKTHTSFFPVENMNDTARKKTFWFRGLISIDSPLVNVPLSLIFTGKGKMEVYVDGRKYLSVDGFDDKEQKNYALQNWPAFVSFPTKGVHHLAVRYRGENFNDEDLFGVSLSVKKVGYTFTTSLNNHDFAAQGILSIGIVFGVLAFIHILMFLFYRKDVTNLTFSIFNISIAIMLYLFYRIVIVNQILWIDRHSGDIMSICIIVAAFSLCALITQLFSKKKIILWIIGAVAVAALFINFIDSHFSSDIADYIMPLLLIGAILYTIIQIIIALVKKVPGARILGLGVLYFLLFVLGVVFYVLITKEFNANSLVLILTILAIFSIPLSLTAFMAWRFAYTNKVLENQLSTVENLSKEKAEILETQNEKLELEVASRTNELQMEKQKSDDLLLNILPEEIANELKLKGESKAQQYDKVSVLFTDFVNFTQTSEQLGVDELLNELNINFTAFDGIMEKHGMEKIKTIGDAYLAVSGLPLANPHHAQNAVNAALEIIEFVQKRKNEVPYGLDIRIGINSGSLIAGIIGVKKFAYDIWGDTVNIAARMEQSSMPGKINISDNTYQLVKEDFDCEHRGKIDAKGKGAMDMYFVRANKSI